MDTFFGSVINTQNYLIMIDTQDGKKIAVKIAIWNKFQDSSAAMKQIIIMML